MSHISLGPTPGCDALTLNAGLAFLGLCVLGAGLLLVLAGSLIYAAVDLWKGNA